MNHQPQEPLVSLKQADGALFPLLHREGGKKNQVSLVPAREGQEEVRLSFYYHSSGQEQPELLGVMKFVFEPSSPREEELKLEAEIDRENHLVISLFHQLSNRKGKFQVSLPINSPSEKEKIKSSAPAALPEEDNNPRSFFRSKRGWLLLLLLGILVAAVLLLFQDGGSGEWLESFFKTVGRDIFSDSPGWELV